MVTSMLLDLGEQKFFVVGCPYPVAGLNSRVAAPEEKYLY